MSCLTHTLIMEASSPLASMQASSFNVTCGSQADTLVSFGSSAMLAPHSFNFKDLSMMRKTKTKSDSDYFSSKPMRGSSPTASLAADLSQNFHIDQSPYLPTPRRSLFPTRSNLFLSSNGNALLTTPPILSSSPGDCMEISPLPHKLPASAYLQSPTPEPTPSADSTSMLGSTSISELLLEPHALILQPLKKKHLPRRPSLLKGHTTSELPRRPSVESQLPPFRFGNGISQQTAASSLSLSEAFESSPPVEKTQSRNLPAMAPPRFHPFSNAVPNIRGGGGGSPLSNHARKMSNPPLNNHARKMSNPPARPRKQARRSHSMYENPGQVVLQRKVSPPLDSIMDIEHQGPQLPHFTKDVEAVPRITRETMIDVLDGKYGHVHDKLIVIDCRFGYEYEGGHIKDAINVSDKEKLAEHLFDRSSPLSTSRSLVIFHCEYSVHRAPIMAQFFRSHDRKVNPERYPALTYPESYVLDGGYKSFFQSYRTLCIPEAYVEMNAKQHAEDCEKGMGKVKKQRMKLGRAQTFAGFDQGSSPMNSSPIGPRGSLHRHASDTVWSPAALGRAETRNPREYIMEAINTSSDTSMGLSDSDVDMDTTTDLPTFNRISFGGPLEAGPAPTRRMFSSLN